MYIRYSVEVSKYRLKDRHNIYMSLPDKLPEHMLHHYYHIPFKDLCS